MYLFIDTETTGLPLNWNAPITNLKNWPRLVQLAWEYYDKDGNKLSCKDYIIKPDGFTIPNDVVRIHGITTEEAIEKGFTLINVLEEFKLMVDQCEYLVAHNMNFDEKILGAEFLRCKIENCLASKKKICTMKNTTVFCSIKSKYGYKYPSLSELHFKLFKTSFEEAHNAVTDIAVTAKCFWELKRLNVI